MFLVKSAISAVIVVLCTILLSTPLEAQQDSSGAGSGFWFEGGFGTGQAPKGLHAAMGLSMSPGGTWVFGIRRSGTTATADDLGDEMESYEALVGLQTWPNFVVLKASAGISLLKYSTWEVTGTSLWGVPTAKHVDRSAVGIPLEVEISVRPFRFIGIGFRAFGHISSVQRYSGSYVFVDIGVVR